MKELKGRKLFDLFLLLLFYLGFEVYKLTEVICVKLVLNKLDMQGMDRTALQ